jgi:chaperonin GroES
MEQKKSTLSEIAGAIEGDLFREKHFESDRAKEDYVKSFGEISKTSDDRMLWGEKKAAVDKTPIPLQDRILVSKTKPEQMSAGGIIIPSIAINDAKTGVVIAVGPKISDNDSSLLRPGQLVEFGEYAGTVIKYDGKEYLIMREADILCILP